MSHALASTPGAAIAAAMSTLRNFAASLLPFLVTVLTAFVVIPEEAYADPATLLQFGGLIVQTAISLLVPLVALTWRGALKTGLSLVAAILTGVLTYIVGDGLSVPNVVLIVISVLTVLAAEIGVQIRTAPVENPPALDGTQSLTSLPEQPVRGPLGGAGDSGASLE